MALGRRKSSSRSRSAAGKPKVSANVRRAPARKGVGGAPQFAVCVKNEDYPASLELKKIYTVLSDPFGEEHGLVRVIDESGEDYLFPRDYFVAIDLPASLRQRLRRIA